MNETRLLSEKGERKVCVYVVRGVRKDLTNAQSNDYCATGNGDL